MTIALACWRGCLRMILGLKSTASRDGRPMYFVYRNGTYVDVSGESWHDFMEGKLPQLPGDTPTIDDWEQHLTTVFPEVRLKRYMEMRGADGGSFEAIMALPALWVGLLYSSKSLDDAEKLTSDWTQAERDALRNGVTKDGLSTKFRDGTATTSPRKWFASLRTV